MNYLLVIIHSLTGVVGPWLWRARAFDILPLASPAWLPARLQQATVNEIIITGVRRKPTCLQKRPHRCLTHYCTSDTPVPFLQAKRVFERRCRW